MLLDTNTIIYILLGLFVILLGFVVYLHLKLKKILLGKDAKTLEDSIVWNKKEIDKLREFEKDAMAYFQDVEKRLLRSIQSVETIRFNPFKGTGDGGNQSFSTSFLNEEGRGVVISTMYSRDRISVFGKPLEKFESPFELTEEESTVVDKAKKSF